MTGCAAPACDGEAAIQGKFSTWCEDHGTLLAEVRKSLRRKSAPARAVKLTGAQRAKIVSEAAEQIAAAAREQPGREDAPEVVGLGFETEAYQHALTRAKRQGWVVVHDHVCVSPGPVDPPIPSKRDSATLAKPGVVSRHDRALKLARAVHAADGAWLSSDDAAKAVGCAPMSLSRVARIGREEGWIVAQRGRPGYHAGPTPPPVE